MKHMSRKKKLVFSIVCLLFVFTWSRFGADITLEMYKYKVKRYVDTQEYSDKKKDVLYAAIENIQSPENISDYKMIYISKTEWSDGKCWLIGADQEVEVSVDDWHVVIGDTGLHRYYNAIIDKETLEYLGSVPIA